MSQRQKRKAHRANSKTRSFGNKWKWLAGVVVILVLAVAIAVNWVKGYLHSDAFRQKVASKVSEEIGVPAELGEMRWSGLHLESDGFSAQSEGALQRLEAVNMALDVDTDYWAREVWDISNVEIDSASLKLDLRKEFTTVEFPEEPRSWIEDWVPSSAELHNAKVHRADAEVITDGGTYLVEGVHLGIEQQDYGYSAELNQGVVKLPFPLVDSAHLQNAKVRFLNNRLVVDHAEFDVFESGSLTLEGEVDIETASYALKGDLTGLRCSDVINDDWKQRLRGDVEATFTVKPKKGSNEPEIKGKLLITDGMLTALPALETVANYTRVSDFKRLKFSEFRCDFYRYGKLTKLTNIYVHCDGLMRVEGRLSIDGEDLDGRFRVGVKRGTLRHIPGAEGKVFLPGKDGMSWATVNVGGTIDDIEEDITASLKAAALGRIFELVGGGTATELGTKAIDTIEDASVGGALDTARGAGEALIDGGLDALDGEVLKDPLKTGSGLIETGLNGLFGGGAREPQKKEDDEE